MRFRFGTKGETLEQLKPLLMSATILDQFRFSAGAWTKSSEALLDALFCKSWSNSFMIVRSSAQGEDSEGASQAGSFLSVAKVLGRDEMRAAIEQVLASYRDPNPRHQILIQPMLTQVTMAGVVFSADLDTLAPYYSVNFERGGATDGVTSGQQAGLETFVRFRDTPFPVRDPELETLLTAVQELEKLTGTPYLDIEFAFEAQTGLVILQVRPIVITTKSPPPLTGSLAEPLRKLYRKIQKLSAPHPNLLGNRAIYGVMPDWNPAEIVGRRPRPLALSLYKEVITDQIWAYQRDNYGYRNLRSHPLLVSFLGLPYIDVRVSFNSFIPQSLHLDIAERLTDYYLSELAAAPQRHDKVEFEIVHSCYSLDLPEKLETLQSVGFSKTACKRIEFSLLQLSNGIMDPHDGLYKKDLEKVARLKARHEAIVHSDLSTVDKIYWLLEECKRYGTLPFAGIARAAFVAVQSLNALVTMGILNPQERSAFLNSLNTVSKALSRDLHALSQGQMGREVFLEKYGHLRPGTYDILSPRYDQAFEMYFGNPSPPLAEEAPFQFSLTQKQAITSLLAEHGLRLNADTFIEFMVQAIEGREYAKFVFTRSLSEVIELVRIFGEKLDLDEQAMSYLDIQVVRDLYARLDCRDVRAIFLGNIEANRSNYAYTQTVKLPSLIVDPEDVYQFYIYNEEPNFITLKDVVAETLLEPDFGDQSFVGKIAFIASADPGYDYLFTKGIVGLVTQYGGANSHMAIRCAELGLPAVIGAGSRNFETWCRAKRLSLNCQTRQVQVLA